MTPIYQSRLLSVMHAVGRMAVADAVPLRRLTDDHRPKRRMVSRHVDRAAIERCANEGAVI